MKRDDITADLPGVPRKRGRPPTGQAKSGADRQAAYLQRKKAEGREAVTVLLDVEVAEALRAHVARMNADLSKDGLTLGEAAGKIIRDRLMRKR